MSMLPQVAMVGTSIAVGLTMVVGINAINSAPSFMLEYYKYLAGNESTEPRSPVFWNNILNFYTVVTLVAQAVHEPTNLTSFMCRFSLLSRLELSCVVMMVELLVILVMPHTHASEYSAIAAMMVVAYLGGAARAYFENTGYALFGPCPPIMLTGMLIGAAGSGALVSTLQIILRAGMADSYSAVLTQSLIYFCLSIGIIFLSGLLLATLLYNPYARRFVAEFRSSRSPWANIYRPRAAVKELSPQRATCVRDGVSGAPDEEAAAQRYMAESGSERDEMTEEEEELLQMGMGDGGRGSGGDAAGVFHAYHHPDTLFDDRVIATREELEAAPTRTGAPQLRGQCDRAGGATAPSSHSHESHTEVHGEVVAATKGGGLDGDDGAARAVHGEDLTTAELLQDVKLWPVVRKVYPMMLTCFLTFGITYLVYPGIMLAVDSADGWYTTLIMAAFNYSDLVGRLLTLWRRLWAPRKVILIASIVRIIFIPLLVLCAAHKIPSKAAAYVFTVIMGMSNGFVGTLSIVYTPETPSLLSDGERAMAGQLTGACLLIGCAVGSLIQLAEVLPFS
ncbi:nucleobase transporter [Novymonas esmeraldas]|uniref:Nucleobase transporter n=1 Tax=Novymonas esmeraldas TaxID=1808958 RepID=A0AAW0EKD7_9TRYP